jgi:hypothetical protein
MREVWPDLAQTFFGRSVAARAGSTDSEAGAVGEGARR